MNTYYILRLLKLIFLTCSILLGTSLCAQNDEDGSPTHYIFPDFTQGIVRLKDGSTQTSMLNYNKLTEEMIFVSNGVNLALMNLEKIDSVIIQNRKFVPHDKVFYEVIYSASLPVYIQHFSALQSAGSQVGYGGTSMTSSTTTVTSMASTGLVYNLKLPAEYTINDDTHFWIKKDGVCYKADTEKQIKKIYPGKEKVIYETIKEMR